MPPKASSKVATETAAPKKTTTTKKLTKSTPEEEEPKKTEKSSKTEKTEKTEKTTKTKQIPPEKQNPPTKSEIVQFVNAYFVPSTHPLASSTHPDPVIAQYTASPETFNFVQDNGKGFELKLTKPDATRVSEKEEKESIISILSLHAEFIRFTIPYQNKAKILCLITKNEIIPSLSVIRQSFSGPVFRRDYLRKFPTKRKLDDEESETKKKAKNAKLDAKSQKLVQLGKDSDSDDDSDSSDSDSDDDDDEEREYD